MPTLMIALASALLLAALVTETTQRFFPDSYLALLVITFVALTINGLFNAKLKQGTAQSKSAGQSRQGSNRDRKPRNQDKKAGGQNRNNDNRGRKDNRQDRQSPRQADKSQHETKRREKPKPQQKSAEQSAQGGEEKANLGPQETGTVKWFNRTKGYGFIIRDNGEEVFVHQRSIVGHGEQKQRPVLQDGQKVSFVVAHLEKGAQAEQVQGLD